MAKKHAHEEHENHERWVISFADMMTLLFALFVVLYALKTDDSAAKSIVKNFAVAVEGSGRSRVSGKHTGGSSGGAHSDGVALRNAQKQDLELLLREILSEFQHVDGGSSVTRQLDDMTVFETGLSSVYEPTRLDPSDAGIALVERVVGAAKAYHSVIRIRMSVHDCVAGRRSDGVAVNSLTFATQRLQRLRQTLEERLQIQTGAIQVELRNLGYGPGGAGWQAGGEMAFAFTNDR